MLEYKSIPFEVKEVVSVDGGGWEIAGYASTFNDTEPDFYGDTIAPGAFADSIAKRWPKFLFEHAVPIGKTLDIREDAHGLYGRWSIVDTTAGTDAYKLAKAGVLDALSIGFIPEQWEQRADGGRHLTVIDLPEVSAVAVPANTNAVITDVKSRPFDRHSEDVRVAVSDWLARVRSGSDQRQQDGRSLSAARRALLEAVSGSLRSAADDIAALLTTPEPAPLERLKLDHEQRRRRLARLGIALEVSA